MDYSYACYGSIMYLYIYATFNKARVFHTPHFNLFAQEKLAQLDYVSVILYGRCLLHLKLPDLPAIYNNHSLLTRVIVRAMPLGAGFVDIFIGQIHSESDDQIQ